MRIFISHSSPTKAADLSARLRQEGHQVFYDGTNLAVSDPFDKVIRDEIAKCHLFIFLISPSSIRQRSYALSELEQVERRWSRPAGRVLPVVVEDVEPSTPFPSYLKGMKALRSPGEWQADVLTHVAGIARARKRRIVLALSAASVLTLAGAASALTPSPPPVPPACVVKQTKTTPIGDGYRLEASAQGVPKDHHVYVIEIINGQRYRKGQGELGDGNWKGEITHVSGSVGETRYFTFVAADLVGSRWIDDARETAKRDKIHLPLPKEIEPHLIECGSFELKKLQK